MVPDVIDRVAPTRRPTGERVVMRQTWADLLFLHWPVPPETLAPLLPPGLTLDTFEDGRAYVGLVPFTMTGVRPLWSPPVRGLSDFHETNVRTYVHYEGRDPGVWFFSLDAANAIAVRIARTLWKLPYHFARMKIVHDGARLCHETERLWPGPLPAACRVEYTPAGTPAPAEPGTLEHFLAERYVLYARSRNGRLLRGQVHHAPYPLQTATLHALDETLVAAAGITLPCPNEPPPLVHYARAVSVEVFGLREVRPSPSPPSPPLGGKGGL